MKTDQEHLRDAADHVERNGLHMEAAILRRAADRLERYENTLKGIADQTCWNALESAQYALGREQTTGRAKPSDKETDYRSGY
jgi:hypothetical protein